MMARVLASPKVVEVAGHAGRKGVRADRLTGNRKYRTRGREKDPAIEIPFIALFCCRAAVG